MNFAPSVRERFNQITRTKPTSFSSRWIKRPTVLVATIDQSVCNGLSELLDAFAMNTLWVKCVDHAKNIIRREDVVACLSGFWLQGGTYRELVRHIRRERLDIPVIIVSPPACTDEYRAFVSSMKIGALNFLSHPYTKSDLERILELRTGGCASPSAPAELVSASELRLSKIY